MQIVTAGNPSSGSGKGGSGGRGLWQTGGDERFDGGQHDFGEGGRAVVGQHSVVDKEGWVRGHFAGGIDEGDALGGAEFFGFAEVAGQLEFDPSGVESDYTGISLSQRWR